MKAQLDELQSKLKEVTEENEILKQQSIHHRDDQVSEKLNSPNDQQIDSFALNPPDVSAIPNHQNNQNFDSVDNSNAFDPKQHSLDVSFKNKSVLTPNKEYFICQVHDGNEILTVSSCSLRVSIEFGNKPASSKEIRSDEFCLNLKLTPDFTIRSLVSFLNEFKETVKKKDYDKKAARILLMNSIPKSLNFNSQNEIQDTIFSLLQLSDTTIKMGEYDSSLRRMKQGIHEPFTVWLNRFLFAHSYLKVPTELDLVTRFWCQTNSEWKVLNSFQVAQTQGYKSFQEIFNYFSVNNEVQRIPKKVPSHNNDRRSSRRSDWNSRFDKRSFGRNQSYKQRKEIANFSFNQRNNKNFQKDSKSKQENRTKTKKCYNCNEEGHFARNCPKKSQTVQKSRNNSVQFNLCFNRHGSLIRLLIPVEQAISYKPEFVFIYDSGAGLSAIPYNDATEMNLKLKETEIRAFSASGNQMMVKGRAMINVVVADSAKSIDCLVIEDLVEPLICNKDLLAFGKITIEETDEQFILSVGNQVFRRIDNSGVHKPTRIFPNQAKHLAGFSSDYNDLKSEPCENEILARIAPEITMMPEIDWSEVISLPNEFLSHINELKSLIHKLGANFGKPLNLDRRKDQGIFQINLIDENKIIKQARRFINPKLKPQVEIQLSKMEKDGVIEKVLGNAQIKAISNMVLVPKSDGSLRIAIDFTDLNKNTIELQTKMTNINDCFLQAVKDSRFFAVLDMASGFFHMKVRSEDKLKTCFYGINPTDIWCFKAMPFGTVNSPKAFVNWIAGWSADLEGVTVFVDDFLIEAPTIEKLIERFGNVVERFLELDIRVNPKKIRIGEEVKVLGKIRTHEGWKMDPAKIESIKKLGSPKNRSELMTLLGMLKYLAKSIPNFAEITNPLNKLTSTKRKFEWKEDHQNALKKATQLLEKDIKSFCPDWSREFWIRCDASDLACGGYLFQVDENGKERIIMFFSKSFKNHMLNWSIFEKECFAVVHALLSSTNYISISKVIIETDHRPLLWIFKVTRNNSNLSSKKLQRWVMFVLSFDFELRHIPGKKNFVADCISRNVVEVNLTMTNNLPNITENERNLFERFKELEKEPIDPVFSEDAFETIAKLVLQQKQIPDVFLKPEFDKTWNFVRKHAPKLILKDECLFLENKDLKLIKYIKIDEREEIIKSAHGNQATAGHFAADYIYKLIKNVCFWPGQLTDIKNFVKRCTECQLYKNHRTIDPGIHPFDSCIPCEQWHIDLAINLPLTSRDNKHVLVIKDHATKYLITVAIPNKSAETVAKALTEKVFLTFGFAKAIFSDRGTEFTNQILSSTLSKLGILHNVTPSYSPFVNGLVERENSTLVQILSSLCHGNWENWDLLLPMATLAINVSKPKGLEFSRYFLFFGRPIHTYLHVKTGIDPFVDHKSKFAQEVLKARAVAAALEGRTRKKFKSSKKVVLEEGDFVRIRIFADENKNGSKKLRRRFSIPLKVLKVNKTTCVLQNEIGKEETVHMSHLIKSAVSKDLQLFTPEEILAEEIDNEGTWFFVRWKHHSEFHNSWVFEEDPILKNNTQVVNLWRIKQKENSVSTRSDFPLINSSSCVTSSLNSSRINHDEDEFGDDQTRNRNSRKQLEKSWAFSREKIVDKDVGWATSQNNQDVPINKKLVKDVKSDLSLSPEVCSFDKDSFRASVLNKQLSKENKNEKTNKSCNNSGHCAQKRKMSGNPKQKRKSDNLSKQNKTKTKNKNETKKSKIGGKNKRNGGKNKRNGGKNKRNGAKTKTTKKRKTKNIESFRPKKLKKREEFAVTFENGTHKFHVEEILYHSSTRALNNFVCRVKTLKNEYHVISLRAWEIANLNILEEYIKEKDDVDLRDIEKNNIKRMNC